MSPNTLSAIYITNHITCTSGSGSVYVRWGRNGCPDGVEMMYKGQAFMYRTN